MCSLCSPACSSQRVWVCFILLQMITGIGNVASTNLAVVLTSVEEIVLRATLKLRHDIFRALRGKPPLEGDMLRRQREVWSCAVNTTVMCEVA